MDEPTDPTFGIGINGVRGLNPRLLYFGKSYSDYATDWFNWFLSAHSDNRNLGPVVFLRSKHIPDRPDQVYDLQVSHYPTTTAETATDLYGYPTLYVNEPNIRVGADRLQIFEDQAVFIPIIVAYAYSNHPYKDWGYMQEYIGMTIDNGDNPPALDQLRIDNNPIELPSYLGKEDFTNFRISTPVFTAIVPEAPYGTSMKDFLEEGPISPGSYPAMIAGYFIMLKFNAREGKSYWVHAVASAGREVRGPYFSELLYQIDVHPRPPGWPHGRIFPPGMRPASFQAKASEVLKRLNENFPSADRDQTIQGFKDNWSESGAMTPDSLKSKDKK
jgi:hypothetical protein